jgi:hypothetical protein
MGAVEEATFHEALELTKGVERDLLLGNGFSIAAHDGFDYRRLLDRASIPEDVRGIFAAARTSNFEAVMRILLTEAVGHPREAKEAGEKIQALKVALVQAIHEVHPPRRNQIPQPRWDRCVGFLEHFIGRGRKGRILTTNYDLLLSWAVAPDREQGKHRRLDAYEGFRGGPYDGLAGATIIYLHGALHLYADQGYPRQLQYRSTGVAIHDQVAALLDRNLFPIIVTEGASSLKEPRSPGFLLDAYKAFQGTCRSAGKKALFTLGHGLGPEDSYLLDWIAKGTIQTLCLGAFNRQEEEAFHEIADRWVAARAARGKPLKVYIFNSADQAWGPKPKSEVG